MLSVIIAFPKLEDAKKIKNSVIRYGYEVNAVCTSGAQVIGIVNELDGGIVICGYRLADMHYSELFNYLPGSFEMLLMASPSKLMDCVDNNIVCLNMPVKLNDLLSTLQMMTYRYNRWKKKNKNRPKQRSQAEKETIARAKAVLMERNNMSEEEAHRYIQKSSMDSGTNMTETAEMILSMLLL